MPNLVDALMASLNPTIASLTTSFGATAALYRATDVIAADRSVTKTYTKSDVVTAFLLSPQAARRAHTYGITEHATMVLAVPVTLGALGLHVLDAVVITAGPYTGRRFLVDGPSYTDSVGAYSNTSLVEAPPALVL